MIDDLKKRIETIESFIDAIIEDMNNISKTTTKINMAAYISAWKSELQTIKQIIKIE
jgi:hypothetical protein